MKEDKHFCYAHNLRDLYTAILSVNKGYTKKKKKNTHLIFEAEI